MKAGGGTNDKNWPKCCPFMKHDIEGEIPLEMQRLVKYAYYSWIGLVVADCWNFLCITVGKTITIVHIRRH